MSTVTAPRLLTAEEFFALPDDGRPSELVRGEIVYMNMPGFRHGEICGRIARLIGNFVEDHDLGRTICNDTGVITTRNPDTVRGADVAFYSYARVPKGESPIGYANAVPEVVFEVVSPTNTRRQIVVKCAEYLSAGVGVVAVVDPAFKTVELHYPDRPVRTLEDADTVVLEAIPGLALQVATVFG
jgi:Uma2 family endonuclease